jgi:hypothetical protein
MPIQRTPPKKVIEPKKVNEEEEEVELCSCGQPIIDGDYDECRYCDQQRCDNEYEDGEIDEDGNPTNPEEELLKRKILLEDKHLLNLKETNQIPSRNWKVGLVKMSRYDSEDEDVFYTNDELELMGGYASDSSHESYHGDGIFSHFSKTTQLHSNFYREK